VSESSILSVKEEKCRRCGDFFYDPKTMIEDARQSASAWENRAKELEKKLDELNWRFSFATETIYWLEEFTTIVTKTTRSEQLRDEAAFFRQRISRAIEIIRS
jgi:hypothetical protein